MKANFDNEPAMIVNGPAMALLAMNLPSMGVRPSRGKKMIIEHMAVASQNRMFFSE
jgi:hypothetical protein